MNIASWCLILALLLLIEQDDAKLVGFTIDDESCSGTGNQTQQILVCQQYFTLLANWTAFLQLQKAQLNIDLFLSVDAGTGWTCDPQTTTGDCFNLTYNNKTASVAEHVVDLSNVTVLMAYDQNATNALERAKPYLKYGESVKKAIAVGLAIADHGVKPTWWQTGSEQELKTLMTTLETLLRPTFNKVFSGFAVFMDTTWYDNSRANPCDECDWMHDSYVWYLEHDTVYNETRQVQWLAWASSRHIVGIFVAPHAGDRPFIGGSTDDERRFCAFLTKADAKHIDVQFFSSIEEAASQDIPFAQACNLTVSTVDKSKPARGGLLSSTPY